MKFLRILRSFKRDDGGALAFDWAMLAASVVGLGQVVMTVIGSSLTGLGDAVVIDRRNRKLG